MSGNHEDAPKDVIKTEGRIEKLSQIKRVKRNYDIINADYWKSQISNKRWKFATEEQNHIETDQQQAWASPTPLTPPTLKYIIIIIILNMLYIF